MDAQKYEIVDITTSDGMVLNGLFASPKRAKGCVVFTHGLTSSVFSTLSREIAANLYKQGYAVFLYNNRGAHIMKLIEKKDSRISGGARDVLQGFAYEDFEESIHDVEAAVAFARKKYKRVHLLGHSSGCQKSIFFLAKKKKHEVSSALLLAPLSDIAGWRKMLKNDFETLVGYASMQVENGRGDELIDGSLVPWTLTYNRFLSLATENSSEEIFTYATGKVPRLLRSVKVPQLVVLAGDDEYADRPVMDIVRWFEDTIKAEDKNVVWVEGAAHSFGEHKKELNETIVQWLSTH